MTRNDITGDRIARAMRKIYIFGCTAVAVAFAIWAFYCLSVGDNDRALMLFYGALICLIVPSQCGDCGGTRKVGGLPCPVCCPTDDGPDEGNG